MQSQPCPITQRSRDARVTPLRLPHLSQGAARTEGQKRKEAGQRDPGVKWPRGGGGGELEACKVSTKRGGIRAFACERRLCVVFHASEQRDGNRSWSLRYAHGSAWRQLSGCRQSESVLIWRLRPLHKELVRLAGKTAYATESQARTCACGDRRVKAPVRSRVSFSPRAATPSKYNALLSSFAARARTVGDTPLHSCCIPAF